jgi:micrococcal nuclease
MAAAFETFRLTMRPLVGRVFVEGMNVNAEMIRRGAAWVFRKYARDVSLFALEEEARRERPGL